MYYKNPEEFVVLYLDESLLNDLLEKYGEPAFTYQNKIRRMAQIPTKLFDFCIDSLYQEIEALIAEYMRKFERSLVKEPEQPSLCCEASTENNKQKKKKKKKKRAKKFNDITPDQLALEMAHDKLIENFPSLDKNLLLELLKCQKNNYEKTIDILLLLCGHCRNRKNSIDIIKKPPLTKDLLNKIENDFLAYKDEMVTKKPSGQEYRKQVDTYLKNQKSLYKEASKYKQEGLVKVAQFYSNLANKQALYYKRVIAQVVSIFLKVNSKGLPTNLLNLHYLRLNEAKKLVDEFLDNHINYLRKNSDKTKHELNIITGRGKHSPGGIPVLRPAIWNYLKKRALKIRLINQGSIRVHITANSKLTNELSQIS